MTILPHTTPTTTTVLLKAAAAAALLSSQLHSVVAALPPGYEDSMWCPEGYCDRYVEQPEGFAGPASVFHECYNPSTNATDPGVWTGSLSETVAPDGWVEGPEACD